MKDDKGFTLIELVISLFICSLIVVFLLPNLVRQYQKISNLEKKLEMKEVLYEELSNNVGENVTKFRNTYKINIYERTAKIEDERNDIIIEYK